MQGPARIAAALSVAFLQTACVRFAEIPARFDRGAFARLGGTFFSKPDQLTMKEVHLDHGSMAGREIIVAGEVKEVSEHYTYVVLEDDSARMLVVLTGLASAAPWLKDEKPKQLRVLGTIESGKKGLPYIRATALNDGGDAAPPKGT